MVIQSVFPAPAIKQSTPTSETTLWTTVQAFFHKITDFGNKTPKTSPNEKYTTTNTQRLSVDPIVPTSVADCPKKQISREGKPDISPNMLVQEDKEKIADAAAQQFFSHHTKSSFEKCVFINLFHRCRVQKCFLHLPSESASFRTSLRRFIGCYMRSWEKLCNSSDIENKFIHEFKLFEHKNLSRPEWELIHSYVDSCVGTFEFEKSSEFIKFASIVKDYLNRRSSIIVAENVNSGTSPSLLRMALMESQTNEHVKKSAAIASSNTELFKLYFCIYYPNFLELWDSTHIILQGSLLDSIEAFIREHPFIDPLALNHLLKCI